MDITNLPRLLSQELFFILHSMKKALIIIISLIIGAVVGYFSPSLFLKLSTASRMQDILNNFGDVVTDLNLCKDVASTDINNCLNANLFQAAVVLRSTDPCMQINNPDILNDCIRKVEVVVNFDQSPAADFCSGIDVEECYDIGLILLAQMTLNGENCNQIINPILQQACFQLVNTTPLPIVQGDTFGIDCLPGDATCLVAQSAFNKAVLSGDVSGCESSFIPVEEKQRCEFETQFYAVYKTGDSTGCYNLDDQIVSNCLVTVVTAFGVDANDQGLCLTLPELGLAEACQGLIDVAPGGRFDYIE